MDGGEEISCSFVEAGGDSAELFEFAEEIFDQMSCLVNFLVERTRCFSVLPGRYDGRFSGGCQWPDGAIIGIEGLVGDQDVSGHLRQQGIGAGQIVNLSCLPESRRRRTGRADLFARASGRFPRIAAGAPEITVPALSSRLGLPKRHSDGDAASGDMRESW
jgi:hypothetical protein